MSVAAALLLLLTAATASPTDTHKGWNAAAEAVARLSRGLGIDFEDRASNAGHPSAEDVQAFNKAGFGAWLDSQIDTPDDSIGEPPAAIRDFLDERSSVVWGVIASLE